MKNIIKWRPIEFAPFDLLAYARLAMFVLLWKHASQDYSALTWLAGREPYFQPKPDFMAHLAQWIQPLFTSASWVPTLAQLIGIGLLIIAIWRPSRISILLALIPVCLVEFSAYHWRYQNWDFDFPIAILLMLCIFPAQFGKIISSDRAVSRDATRAGRYIATYMACIYVLAGLSKVKFGLDWAFVADLGNNYRTQFLDNAPYSEFSSFFAAPFSAAFIDYPFFAHAIAILVQLAQIFMPLALFFVWPRIIMPTAVFANHVGIFFSLGIFFSSMPILGEGIFVPWRLLRLPKFLGGKAHETKEHVNVKNGWHLGMTLVAVVLALVPGLTHTVYHPFADNFIFAWRYNSPEEYVSDFKIGYLDAADGKYKAFPRGYGGFMESRQSTFFESTAPALAFNPDSISLHKYNIESFFCASRPRDSNRWLLGPLALPEHRLSLFPKADLSSWEKLYVLKAYPNQDDVADKHAVVKVEWKPVLDIPAPKCNNGA